MNEQEVIVMNGIPDKDYENLLESCVRYAIISLPFTANRMELASIKQRVLNIAKGKIAEALFWYFCKHNKLQADFTSCATAFWQVDKKDFLLDGYEWDIKNNFIYHTSPTFPAYTSLPALIPNRFEGDQWSKRSETTGNKVKGAKYLFTFLKGAGLTKFKEREQEFLELHLTAEQEQFLHALYSQYKGKPQRKEPFTKEWFWNQIETKGPANFYTLHDRPYLVITGYADGSTFHLFKDTGPETPFNYQEFVKPVWYTRSAKTKSLNFMDGTIWTTIRNAACPIALLPSFLSYFPHLKSELQVAKMT